MFVCFAFVLCVCFYLLVFVFCAESPPHYGMLTLQMRSMAESEREREREKEKLKQGGRTCAVFVAPVRRLSQAAVEN